MIDKTIIAELMIYSLMLLHCAYFLFL